MDIKIKVYKDNPTAGSIGDDINPLDLGGGMFEYKYIVPQTGYIYFEVIGEFGGYPQKGVVMVEGKLI